MSNTSKPLSKNARENLGKLKTKLRELFQLDRGDLDFGLYRIMALKSAEIEDFLDNYLLLQITEALGEIAESDISSRREELQKATEEAEKLGYNPEESSKIKEIKAQIKAAEKDQQKEADVYNHLYNFFSRYYDEGDFMSLRRYKSAGKEAYSIPYNGEEVKLHWANADQYYIKTTENYSSYVFIVKKSKEELRVRFEIIAADNEKDSIKEIDGNKRFFILAKNFLSEEKQPSTKNRDLIIRFEHRPLTEGEKIQYQKNSNNKQKEINKYAEEKIRKKLTNDWLILVRTICPTETNDSRTLLGKHITAYTSKNSFDYFIHKDLGGFLHRELDFYLKSEVISIDNLELTDDSTVFTRNLAQVKAIKKVGSKIIDFLAQLEDFQKKLWLKKKFILETQYCVTLDKIPESLYTEIVENKAQCEEWIKLFAINELNGDLISTAYSKPLKPKFLEENPYLILDTRYFNKEFTDKLLAALSKTGPIEEQMNGLLVHGENFQALNLMQERYREQVQCVYIDPPYNTDDEDFAYKDNYMHSSWMSAIQDRLIISREMMSFNGQFISHIDENEDCYLQNIIKNIFKKQNFLGVMVWNKRNPKGDAQGLSIQHENLIWAVKDKNFLQSKDNGLSRPKRNANKILEMASKIRKKSNNLDEAREKFRSWIKQQHFSGGEIAYQKIDENGEVFQEVSMAWPNRKQAPKEYFKPLIHPVTKKPCPTPKRGWRNSPSKMKELLHDKLIIFGDDETTQPRRKYLLRDNMSENIPSVFEYGGSADNEASALGLFFETMKPLAISEYVCHLNQQSGNILDYFAGSGTSGHAVINLNREDKGTRKYILVEIGHHFETVLLPRIKKAVYSKDWKNSKPEKREGISQLFRYVRLESYEDTLDSLTIKSRRDLFEDKGNKKFIEDYQLRYALGEETGESSSLLGEDFMNPFNYTLSVVRDGIRRDEKVDLPETFNFLLGLRLHSRRLIDDVLTITGVNSKNENCLILWRNLQTMQSSKLDKWFIKHRTNFSDNLNLIYINGDHTLNALRQPTDRWEAITTEPVFRKLMFKGTE